MLYTSAVTRQDLVARATVLERMSDHATAQLLRAVAAEPHRILEDPEARRLHDRLSPLHRAVYVAILQGNGEVVPYAMIRAAGWGEHPPVNVGQAIRQSICRMQPLLPAGWRFVCVAKVGYRLVRNG